MTNMSYCRFQNTARDLADCADNLDANDLSNDERRARIELVVTAMDILSNVLDACGDLDFDDLDTHFNRRDLIAKALESNEEEEVKGCYECGDEMSDDECGDDVRHVIRRPLRGESLLALVCDDCAEENAARDDLRERRLAGKMID